jgi:phage gp45-like
MSWWENLLRRARLRGLKEGGVQTVRAEALEHDAKDDCERWQDYGFAGNPGDGQGLVQNAGGHTLVVRMDRIAERPQLAPLEVIVWHSEAHYIKMKAGRIIEIVCDQLTINASSGIALNTPVVTASAKVQAQQVEAATSLKVATKEVLGHNHGGAVPPF